MKIRVLVTLFAALALTVGVATATAGNGHGGKGGNSAAAKLCQHGGWKRLHRADGSSFKNDGACVSYAARGGVLSAFELSQGTCPSGTPAGSVCVFLFGVGLQPGSLIGGVLSFNAGLISFSFGPVAGAAVPANGIVDGLFAVTTPCTALLSATASGTAAGGAAVSATLTSADLTC